MPEARKPTLSLGLPDGEDVEIYLVRLSDGRIVARCRDELDALGEPVAEPETVGLGSSRPPQSEEPA